MINVDISNIWGSISLPDLLAEEKNVFEAHLALGGGECKQNPWFSWLSTSDEVRRKWVGPVITAAEKIRVNSQFLVVVGGGLPAAAARAAIRLLPTRAGNLRLLFVGENYSPERWLQVVQTLSNADFSVLLMASGENRTASFVALRSLRRIMDKRYGDAAGQRIYIAGAEESSLSRLAEKLRCTLLPTPQQRYAGTGALTPGALLIMAAAGIDPAQIFSGAAAFYEEADIRSFENPLWLYAAARKLLRDTGRTCETVCTTVPCAESLGSWWQGVLRAVGSPGLFPHHGRLPEDFALMSDHMLQSGQFATVLRLPTAGKQVKVESDFQNLDGLGSISALQLGDLDLRTTEAVLQAFSDRDLPYISIDCDEAVAGKTVGQLLLFGEMSAVLSAQLMGASPAEPPAGREIFRTLEEELKRN